MTPRTFTLEQINVASPCHADWNAMSGDDQKRFCGHCEKHVHNLSAMTRTAAEELVCSNAGHLCVQYQKDAAGVMITLDYAPTTPSRWWMRWRPLAAAATLVSGLFVMVGVTRANPGTVALGGQVATTAPTSQPSPPPTMGTPVPPAIRGDVALPPTSQPSGETIKGQMLVPAPER
jgi:hypothetical protein